jgi:hypothetical protein
MALDFNAGYGRVTGPLGGANFLSMDDYNKIDPLSPGKEANAMFDRGQAAKGRRLENEKSQFELDQAKAQAPMKNKLASLLMEDDAPAQQGPAPVAQAPAMPDAAPGASMAAPEQAQTFPVSPGGAPATAPQAVPPQAASAPSAMPGATSASAPMSSAAPAQASAAEPSALPTSAAPVASVPADGVPGEPIVPTAPPAPTLPRGLSQERRDATVAKIMKAAQAGEFTPQFAQGAVQSLDALRGKQIEDWTKLQEKLQVISGKKIDDDKKALELAAAQRSFMDNRANEVYQAFKSGDIGLARSVAAANKMPIDFDNPQQVQAMTTQAKRSPDFKEMQKVQKEGDKEDREATLGKMDAGAVPAGWSATAQRQQDGSMKKVFTKPDGSTASGAEVEAAIKAEGDAKLKRAAAGAPKTTVQLSSTQQTEFAKKIGESDAGDLKAAEAKADAAVTSHALGKQIFDVTSTPGKLPLGGASGIKVLAQRVFGQSATEAQQSQLAEQVKQASANLALQEARKNKGQGALSDGERELMRRASAGDLSFTQEEWRLWSAAQLRASQGQVREANAAIKRIGSNNKDVQLGDRVRDVPQSGIREIDEARSPVGVVMNPPEKATVTGNKKISSQAEYDALPPGTPFEFNGKPGVKGGGRSASGRVQ